MRIALQIQPFHPDALNSSKEHYLGKLGGGNKCSSFSNNFWFVFCSHMQKKYKC